MYQINSRTERGEANRCRIIRGVVDGAFHHDLPKRIHDFDGGGDLDFWSIIIHSSMVFGR